MSLYKAMKKAKAEMPDAPTPPALKTPLRLENDCAIVDVNSDIVALVNELPGCAELVRRANGWEKLKDAAEVRFRHGHNDTCGSELGDEYPCSCGHDGLRNALAAGET